MLLIILGLIFPAGNVLSKTKIEQIHSESNLQALTKFALEYKSENSGRQPAAMKELVHYAGGDLEVFYLPNPGTTRPADWSTNADRIDQFGGYCLAETASTHILVYEKPASWSDGTIGVGLMDGKVNRLSSQEFKKLKVQLAIWQINASGRGPA